MTQEYAYGMWVIAAFNVGLFLVITGFLVQWPTLLTVLMAPILLFAGLFYLMMRLGCGSRMGHGKHGEHAGPGRTFCPALNG